MEQKRQKALDMIERMKLQASDNIEKGLELYVMHATCAVEFADLLTELLTTEATSAPKSEIPADAPIRVTIECDGEKRVCETIMMFLALIESDGNVGAYFHSRNATEKHAFKIYSSLLKSADVLDEDGLFEELYDAVGEKLFETKMIEKEPADHD